MLSEGASNLRTTLFSIIILLLANFYIVPLCNFIANITVSQPDSTAGVKNRLRVLVVADATVADYYGEYLEEYLSNVFEIAGHAFNHSSLGQEGKIEMELVYTLRLDSNSTLRLTKDAEIVGLKNKTAPFDAVSALDAEIFLQRFCAWQQELRQGTDIKYDAAVLMTKRSLFHHLKYLISPTESSTSDEASSSSASSNTLNQFAGMAYLGAICRVGFNCVVVQDKGVDTPRILAHELGHLLSLVDDEDSVCQKLKRWGLIDLPNADEKAFIMQSIWHMSTKDSWFQWSECSKLCMEEFISGTRTNCLRGPSRGQIQRTVKRVDDNQKPTVQENEDEDGNADPKIQCQRWLPNSWSIKNGTLFLSSPCPGPLNCNQLSCTQGEEEGCITSLDLRWLDKTPCGQSSWCMSGVCVEKNDVNNLT